MSFLVASFYFFYFAVIAVHIIFIPKVLNLLGYAPSEIGIIFSAAPLVRFILPFFFLKGLELSQTIFKSSLVLLVVSGILFYLSLHNFYALLFTNIILGIALGLTLPYVEVIALEYIGHERYGKVRLFGSVGFILVALLLVKFLSSAEVAIFYLMSMLSLSALFAYLISKKEQKQHHRSASAYSSTFDFKSHWSLWLGLILMQVSFAPYYNFFTIFETAHGVSMDMSVYLWSFGVVVEILMLYTQGRLLRHNLLLILQITTAFTAFRWFLIYQFPDDLAILFAAQSLHALSFALFHSAAISYLYSLYPQKKLAQQFFLGLTYGFGGLIGAITSGYIYEYMPQKLFLIGAFVALAATLSLYLSYMKSLKTIHE